MSGDIVKRRLSKGYPTSHAGEVSLPTGQFGIEVVNDEFEVIIRGFLVVDWETQVFPKEVKVIDRENGREMVFGVSRAIPGEQDFGFGVVNLLARVLGKLLKNFGDGITVVYRGFGKEYEVINKEKMRKVRSFLTDGNRGPSKEVNLMVYSPRQV